MEACLAWMVRVFGMAENTPESAFIVIWRNGSHKDRASNFHAKNQRFLGFHG
jgi:hypothetical protein